MLFHIVREDVNRKYREGTRKNAERERIMKVDTTKIAGFDEMTAEDKLTALLAYEFEEAPPPNAGEAERLKELLSKSNSEAAEYKRQLRAKQSDEEAKAAKDAEEREAILKELEALKTDKAISAHKASYLSLGYDEATADANAKALHKGDFETVFANQKKFIEAQRKAALASAMDKQPGLSSGEPITKENAGDPFEASLRKFAGLPAK